MVYHVCCGYGTNVRAAIQSNSSPRSCARQMACLPCSSCVPFAACFAGEGTTGLPCATQTQNERAKVCGICERIMYAMEVDSATDRKHCLLLLPSPSTKPQSSVKNKQDQRHLQDRHWILPGALLDEISISLINGVVLQECGHSTDGWSCNRFHPGLCEAGSRWSGQGSIALC